MSEVIEAKVGSVAKWEIESNPTTGYSWALVSDEGLKIESEYINDSDLCGAPGIQIFKITSDVKGTFHLTAVYRRPWEDKEPIDKKTVTIVFK